MQEKDTFQIRYSLIKEGFSVLESHAKQLLDNELRNNGQDFEHVVRLKYTYTTIRVINALLADQYTSAINILADYVDPVGSQYAHRIVHSKRPDNLEGWTKFYESAESFMGAWMKLQTDLRVVSGPEQSLPPKPLGTMVVFAFDILFIIGIGDYRGIRFRVDRLFDSMMTK